ncbi:osmotically inducible protein OsmC [Cryobacterium mesophilum]|uniref:OsmC family peroxiredoxin n=1 Tax=Terrimesophilobacter mesophilus TaxID=433647 RepID=A0A4R8V9X8_9MICO|nr:OsmC family peroxiredoxin [Terrimesophilobacter mesophilus]MBB5633268.1 osmotically inducible protein OsmC [Terrimesophilobacter mesophilus]TFB80011.1 OsmC family peroxiredoxin [Terrimesophilobacter mesophilus]
MSIAQRMVETKWEGALATGSGTLNGTSGALDGLPVTWAARTESPGGKTSPEELAAAAHSSCFSMALALVLGEHKLTPTTLVVGSTVTLDAVDGVPTIVSSAITVDGDVPGTDAAGFTALVDEAAKICPISRLFTGANITVEAKYRGA